MGIPRVHHAAAIRRVRVIVERSCRQPESRLLQEHSVGNVSRRTVKHLTCTDANLWESRKSPWRGACA